MAFKKKSFKRKKGFKKIKKGRRTFRKRVVKGKRKSFKRKRSFLKKKRSRGSLTSAVFRQEFGGTVRSGPGAVGQMVFTGHALTGNDLMNTLFVSLVKKLMAQIGVFYASDEDYIARYDDGTAGATYFPQFGIIWRSSPADTTSRETILDPSPTSGSTYTVRTFAVALYAQLITDIRSTITSANYGPPELKEIRLYENRSVTPAQKDKISANIPLDKLVCNVKFFSLLKLQNKTSAEGGTVDTPDKNTEQINVNPLAARLYKGKYMQNYFSHKGQGKATLTSSLFVPINDASHGTVGIGGVIYSNDAKLSRTNYREFPTRRDLDYKKEISFTLHPGQVVSDRLYFKNKIGLNKLMSIILPAISTGTQEAIKYGLAHLLAFDKLVYDRSANLYTTSAAGTPVSLGYEVDSSYNIDVSFKRARSVPYIQINNTKYDPV